MVGDNHMYFELTMGVMPNMVSMEQGLFNNNNDNKLYRIFMQIVQLLECIRATAVKAYYI